jgi:hypothetical protein
MGPGRSSKCHNGRRWVAASADVGFAFASLVLFGIPPAQILVARLWIEKLDLWEGAQYRSRVTGYSVSFLGIAPQATSSAIPRRSDLVALRRQRSHVGIVSGAPGFSHLEGCQRGDE